MPAPAPRRKTSSMLEVDDEGGRTFLRVLIHLTMHDYAPLVSGALQLLFKHFSQRQEAMHTFKQVTMGTWWALALVVSKCCCVKSCGGPVCILLKPWGSSPWCPALRWLCVSSLWYLPLALGQGSLWPALALHLHCRLGFPQSLGAGGRYRLREFPPWSFSREWGRWASDTGPAGVQVPLCQCPVIPV